MSKIIVIGAGPAGMIASIEAAKNGHEVLLIEKNDKAGKKLFITGKGRCNLTNACEPDEFFMNLIRNEKFFYSAYYSFSNHQTMQFFEHNGLSMKIERGMRVFPKSDHSSDVIAVLVKLLKRYNVTVLYQTSIKKLITTENKVTGCLTNNGKKYECENVIVCTGGFSYQATGSTGDGYHFAKEAGHSIQKISPSLVPFETAEDVCNRLMGLSLKNISVTIKNEKKTLYEAFGEMLFTHYGVSGPVILSGSSMVNSEIMKGPLKLLVDLKPALSAEQLDKRLLREFGENSNRQYKNSITKLFPSKLIPIMIEKSEINPEKKVHEITKKERKYLVDLIKGFPLTLTKLRNYNEAIVTKGGVHVKEINPATMESKLVKGLYFAGEILDLDALTGGFNLQIAWSTGYLAGNSVK